MNTISLNDIDILDVGHKIQLHGAIYSDGGTIYLLPLPDEDPYDLKLAVEAFDPDGSGPIMELKVLHMDAAEWEKFLRQTDVLDVAGPDKAILRKSQRQIDQATAWRVYERDGYRCRYCNRKAALTVDHVILWEEGGLSIEDNLISACRRCNKLRGNMQYGEWMASGEYRKLSEKVPIEILSKNISVLRDLPRLQGLKATKQRSR